MPALSDAEALSSIKRGLFAYGMTTRPMLVQPRPGDLAVAVMFREADCWTFEGERFAPALVAVLISRRIIEIGLVPLGIGRRVRPGIWSVGFCRMCLTVH